MEYRMQMKFYPIILSWFMYSASAAFVSAQLPDGWYMSTNENTVEPGNAKDYNIGLDKGTKYNGKVSAYIESRNALAESTGILVQEASPADFRGKRIRLSAFVNADDVRNWGGLFMQVEGRSFGPKSDARLITDFMYDRPIKGTVEWKKRDIVLFVPQETERLVFGVWLQGKGKIWVDDFLIEIVGEDAPLTAGKKILKRPHNLNMED